MASAAKLSIVISAKDNAGKVMSGLQKQATGFGAAIMKNHKAIGIGMTAMGAGILAAGGMAARSFAQFEAGMREVNSMMGLSQDEFEAFSKDVREMSSRIGVDAVESTKALYQAISAGVPEENAITFLEIASNAAIAGVTDTKAAVDGLTTVLNAFKIPMSSAQNVADIMFTTIKGGKTTLDELSTSLYNVAPLAQASGVSFDEVSAAMATMTKQGVPTSVATTQLRAAIQALTAPTARQEKHLAALGLEMSKENIETKGLAGVMGELMGATDGNMATLRKLIGSVEGVQAILALAGENAQSYAADLDAMAHASDGVGAATEAVNEINKGADRQFELMQGKIQGIQLIIGEHLLPVLASLATKTSEIITSMKEWADAHPALASALLKVGGILGVGATIGGPLILLLPSLASGAHMAAGGFRALAGGVAAVKLAGLASVAASLGPIALLLGAGVAIWSEWTGALGGTERKIAGANKLIAEMTEKLEDLVEAGKGESQQAINLRTIISTNTKARDKLIKKMGQQTAATQKTETAIEHLAQDYGPYLEDLKQEENILSTQLAPAQTFWGERIHTMGREIVDLSDKVKGGTDVWEKYYSQFLELHGNLPGVGRIIKESITEPMSESQLAILEATKSWTQFFIDTSPAAKMWDAFGISTEEAFNKVIEMSGRSRGELGTLFGGMERELDDFNVHWKEMVEKAGIDWETFASEFKTTGLETIEEIFFETGELMGLAIRSAQTTLREIIPGSGEWIRAPVSNWAAEVERLNREDAEKAAKAAEQAAAAAAAQAAAAQAAADQGVVPQPRLGYGPGGTTAWVQPGVGLPSGWNWAPQTYDQQLHGKLNQVPEFQQGGRVNAPLGQPVPAILHGGETVTPAGQQAGGVTVVLSNPVFLGDESSARQLADLIGEELQRKYRLGWSPT